MKRIDYYTYVLFGIFILCGFSFFGFAFVQAELNPFEWEQDTRACYTGSIIFISITVFFFAFILEPTVCNDKT